MILHCKKWILISCHLHYATSFIDDYVVYDIVLGRRFLLGCFDHFAKRKIIDFVVTSRFGRFIKVYFSISN